MRPVPWSHLEQYRLKLPGNHWESQPGDDFGAFLIPCGVFQIRCIATVGNTEIPWEHVSVSLENRTPTWAEMDYIKDQFWKPEEMVIQYHVPKSLHVNIHPHCLHMWRPWKLKIPLPPSIAV